MKKFFVLSATMFVLAILATQLAGCDSTGSDEAIPETPDVQEAKAESVCLFMNMYLDVDQTCSAEGYRTAVKDERCYAFLDARLVVVRSNDGYLLLRYEQRSDIVAQDPDSWRDFCPPGFLTVMSKEKFESLQGLYEDRLEKIDEEQRRRLAAEKFIPQQ